MQNYPASKIVLLFIKKFTRSFMRKNIFVLFFLFSYLQWQQASAQILEPVKWEVSQSATGFNEYTLIFKAKIDEGWKVYSKDVPKNGPIPTSIIFENLPEGVKLIGQMEELGSADEAADEFFDNQIIKSYKKRLTLRQKISITQDVKVSGYIDYMSCDVSKCIPLAHEFTFELTAEKTSGQNIDTTIDYSKLKNPVTWKISTEKISEQEYWLKFKANIAPTWKLYAQSSPKGGAQPMQLHFDNNGKTNYILLGKAEEIGELETKAEPLFENKILKYYHGEVELRQKIRIDSSQAVISGYISYQTCDASQCLYGQKDFTLALDGGSIAEVVLSADTSMQTQQQRLPAAFVIDTAFAKNAQCETASQSQITDASNKSLWGTYILGFIGGLIGLLMPCTFPMIPFTISFFTKRTGNRRKGIFEASFYGFCIVLVYFIASLPFLLFGLSGDKLNAFASNNIVNLVFFAVFILFALSLFGLFEIKLPTKWANKADSASDMGGMLGIFFMALTLCIVSFSCTGPILGSLLANSIKDGGKALSVGMVGFGSAFAIAFTLLALFPQLLDKLPKSGGWLNEVKVVFGFIELAFALKFLSNVDLAYHWGILLREIFLGLWALLSVFIFLYLIGVIRFAHDNKKVKFSIGRLFFSGLFLALAIYFASGLPKGRNLSLISGFTPPMFYSIYKYDSSCPLGLNCFHDLDEAVAYAQEVNKPIMIDFTGWTCVNCRKMEEHVWPDNAVYKLISEKYVLVSLYVDDKTALQSDEQYVSAYSGQKVRNLGNKWSDLQASQFNTNSQPYYVLISPDGKVLNQPRAYTPDKVAYANFLQCGLDAFNAISQMAEK
jgi:thiol:disulfide interchange protein DsbD